jgi:bacillithiol biosynthesis deacetylase BshB1
MIKTTKLDILAVAAHPDDVEITIGGTLIKMAEKGYKVGVLDLTRGEMGSYGTPAQRAKEAQKAAQILGVCLRENLGLPDSRIENTYENRVKLVRILRKYKPEVMILPYWEGRHPDHYKAPDLAYEAAYLSGLKKLKAGGEKHRPRKIIYSLAYYDEKPSFIVDITEQMERKLEAIRAYSSQFVNLKAGQEVPFTKTDVFESVRSYNRHFGMMIQKGYGEPYLMKEIMEVDDLLGLSVKSI